MSNEEISLAPQRGENEIGTTDPETPLNNRDGSNGDEGHVSRDQITDSHDIDSASDEDDMAEDDTVNAPTQMGGEDPPYNGADYTAQEGEISHNALPDDNFQTITDVPSPAKMESVLPLDG